MSGNERESPTRGEGFESWKSTTDLCKELWKRDYGEDIPEEVILMVMKLTSAILEAQAARCRAEMAAMFSGSNCAEASTRKHEIESERINDKMTTRYAAPSSRNDSPDAKGEGSQNGTYSLWVPTVHAIQPVLDTHKLKRRWCRQFEAEIMINKRQIATASQPTLDINKSIGENPDSIETQQGDDDSEYVVNDRKKKKAMRFLTSSREVRNYSAEFTNTKECAELLSFSIRNANAAQNSMKQRKLNFHEELFQEEDETQEASRKTTVGHAETRKRKSEEGSDAETNVLDEKKMKLEAVNPKKMASKFSLKKKANKSRQKGSLGAKDIFADISIENIAVKAADVDVDANMRDTVPPTIGPYRLVPQTEENRMTDGTPYPQLQPEQAISIQEEIDEDEEMAHASAPQYTCSQPLTIPTHIDSSDSVNYINTSYDPKVAEWLLNCTATPSSSLTVVPASNRNTAPSSSSFVTSLSFVRSPYYIDGITGEEISFDPLLSIFTEPPATAIKILPPWPSIHGQQPEFQPINVVGGIDVDNSPAHLASPQANDEGTDKPYN